MASFLIIVLALAMAVSAIPKSLTNLYHSYFKCPEQKSIDLSQNPICSYAFAKNVILSTLSFAKEFFSEFVEIHT